MMNVFLSIFFKVVKISLGPSLDLGSGQGKKVLFLKRNYDSHSYPSQPFLGRLTSTSY